MRDPLEAGGSLRHVEWCAVDRGFPASTFGAIELALVVFADTPRGVVGRCRNDTDFVAARGKPGGHFAGVFADARKLGGVVDAVDQDSHLRQCKGECLNRSLRFPAQWLHSVKG